MRRESRGGATQRGTTQQQEEREEKADELGKTATAAQRHEQTVDSWVQGSHGEVQGARSATNARPVWADPATTKGAEDGRCKRPLCVLGPAASSDTQWLPTALRPKPQLPTRKALQDGHLADPTSCPRPLLATVWPHQPLSASPAKLVLVQRAWHWLFRVQNTVPHIFSLLPPLLEPTSLQRPPVTPSRLGALHGI